MDANPNFRFNNIRRLLSHGRRAADEYSMINEGDRIAVGLSGGKDSLALFCMLVNMRLFYPKKYELAAITVDMGFDGAPDLAPLAQWSESHGVPHKTVHTELAKIIFDIRKETNPCSLCSRMRRGILHDAVNEIGFNKLALGHHFDDAVETFMLNLFHEGRLGSFSPVSYLDRKKITLIRPLIYTNEKEIRYFVNHNPELPLIKNVCPEDEKTERENMKRMLETLEHKNKGLKHRIFTAMQKSGIDGY